MKKIRRHALLMKLSQAFATGHRPTCLRLNSRVACTVGRDNLPLYSTDVTDGLGIVLASSCPHLALR
jgi:hypothetical protein